MAFPSSFTLNLATDTVDVVFPLLAQLEPYWYRVWINGTEYTSSILLTGTNGVYSTQGPSSPIEKYIQIPAGVTSTSIPLSYFRIPNFNSSYNSTLAIAGSTFNIAFPLAVWTPEDPDFPVAVDSLTYNPATKLFEVTLTEITENRTIFPFVVIDRTLSTGPYFDFSDGVLENRSDETIIVPTGISFFTFRITDVSLLERTFVISLAGETLTTTVPPDFSEEIIVDPPPGQAAQAATANPYDYSDHLDRIVSALEKLVIAQRSAAISLNSLSVISADINSELNTLNSNISLNNQISNSIAGIQTGIASSQSSIASSQSSISTAQTSIEEHQRTIKELASGTGIHTLSPLEFVGFISTYRRLIEEGSILKWREYEPTEKEVSKALNDLGKYLDKIQRNIPKAF
jgi:hypothetical protein